LAYFLALSASSSSRPRVVSAACRLLGVSKGDMSTVPGSFCSRFAWEVSPVRSDAVLARPVRGAAVSWNATASTLFIKPEALDKSDDRFFEKHGGFVAFSGRFYAWHQDADFHSVRTRENECVGVFVFIHSSRCTPITFVYVYLGCEPRRKLEARSAAYSGSDTYASGRHRVHRLALFLLYLLMKGKRKKRTHSEQLSVFLKNKR
jgi:hypothetical protein